MKRFWRKIRVLSVEDNPADVTMIKELLANRQPNIELSFVHDGQDAVDFLHRRGKFADARRPDIILLDLNLPRLDGREVLREIKQTADLKCIPVLVFSTSNNPEDVHLCYELQANCYFEKPGDLVQFTSTMKAIEECWANLVLLPDYPNAYSSHTVSP